MSRAEHTKGVTLPHGTTKGESMKKATIKRLVLSKETLQDLSKASQLARVVGGGSQILTCDTCTTDHSLCTN
jgi:hypothetical protein